MPLLHRGYGIELLGLIVFAVIAILGLRGDGWFLLFGIAGQLTAPRNVLTPTRETSGPRQGSRPGLSLRCGLNAPHVHFRSLLRVGICFLHPNVGKNPGTERTPCEVVASQG